MSFANKDSLLFFFLVRTTFISFTWPIVTTVLNRSGGNVHIWLVSDLRGNIFSFSPLNMVSCGIVIYGLYYVQVCCSIWSLLKFSLWKDVEFCQMLFLHLEMVTWFLFFVLFYFRETESMWVGERGRKRERES